MDSNKPVYIKTLIAFNLLGAMFFSPETASSSSVEIGAGYGLKRTNQGFYCNKPDICDRQFFLATYRSASTIPTFVSTFAGALLRERIASGISSESWTTRFDHIYSPRINFRFGFESDWVRSEMGLVAGVSNAGLGSPLGEDNSAFALRLPNGFLAPSMETMIRGRNWSLTVGLNPTVVTEKDGMIAALLGFGSDKKSLFLGPVLVNIVEETLGAKMGVRARVTENLHLGVDATAVVTGESAGSWIGSSLVAWNVP